MVRYVSKKGSQALRSKTIASRQAERHLANYIVGLPRTSPHHVGHFVSSRRCHSERDLHCADRAETAMARQALTVDRRLVA
jgi:hypothetical protein